MKYMPENMEEFVDIPGCSGYQINLSQEIKRLAHWSKNRWGAYWKKERVFPTKGRLDEYREFDIVNESGRRICKGVHVLMALAFLENPENKPTVNHISGSPGDNSISNLEWATYSEQVKHAWDTGLTSKVRPVGSLSRRKGKDHPAFGKGGPSHFNAKFILDTATGIYYKGIKDAAAAKANIKADTLRRQLNGNNPNRTSLIYV